MMILHDRGQIDRRSLGGSDSAMHLQCDFWCWQTPTVATPRHRKEAQSMNGSSVLWTHGYQKLVRWQHMIMNLNIDLFILHPKNKSLPSHIPCFISGFYCVQKPSVGFIPDIFVQIHFDYFCGQRWHVGRVIPSEDWIKVESLFLSSLFYWIWFSSPNINKTHKKGLILLIAIKDHSNFGR